MNLAVLAAKTGIVLLAIVLVPCLTVLSAAISAGHIVRRKKGAAR